MTKDKSSCKSSSSSTDCSSSSSSTKCSSSSSSNSIKDCPVTQIQNTAEFVHKFKDGVVSVRSEFIFFGASGDYAEGTSSDFYQFHAGTTSGDLETETAPGASGVNTLRVSDDTDLPRADIILSGNGFFINSSEYIVCPASVVLAPPTVTASAQRWPLVDNNSATLGTIRNQMVAPTRILVTVNGVKNGKERKSYVYECTLVGVFGAGDVAVLKVDMKKAWNRCNPCIPKSHPHFKFENSRKLRPGMPVYLMGNGGSIGDYYTPVFNSGWVCDHRHAEATGWVLPETVLVSTSTYCLTPGLPLLNVEGHVVGMQTTDIVSVLQPYQVDEVQQIVGRKEYDVENINLNPDVDLGNLFVTANATNGRVATVANQEDTYQGVITLTPTIPPNQMPPYTTRNTRVGTGLTVCVSSYFMERIVKALIQGRCPRESADTSLVESYPDDAGSYWVYRTAYLGLAYDIPHTNYMDVTVNYDAKLYDSTATPVFGTDIIAHGQPQVRLEAGTSPDGDYGLMSEPSDAKKVKGIRVLGLAGAGPLNTGTNVDDDKHLVVDTDNQDMGFWFVPGAQCALYRNTGGAVNGAALPNPLVDSPFLSVLQTGDLILSMTVNNGTSCTLGGLGSEDEHDQVVPSILLWRYLPGDQIEICYKRGGYDANDSVDNDATANYTNTYTYTKTAASMPWSLNFPWYSQLFPVIGLEYPNFQVANNLSTSNNFPMIQGGGLGWFRPPI
jgi:hypothetical protein